MSYRLAGKVNTQTYTPDGKEKIVSQGNGSETTETSGRAYMLGGLQNQSHSTELIHCTERWSLSADGNTLTGEVDNPKSVSVFDKEPANAPTGGV